MTNTYIKEWQRVLGVTVDGVFGADTLSVSKQYTNEPMSTGKYFLGKRSLKELKGVHPVLIKVVKEAIKLTKQDFMVLDGLRTPKEQRKLVARGVSRTFDSYHLYGLAVDLVAIDKAGKPSWNTQEVDYKEIHTAMGKAMEMLDLVGLIANGFYDLGWGFDMPHYQLTKLACHGTDPKHYYINQKDKGFI